LEGEFEHSAEGEHFEDAISSVLLSEVELLLQIFGVVLGLRRRLAERVIKPHFANGCGPGIGSATHIRGNVYGHVSDGLALDEEVVRIVFLGCEQDVSSSSSLRKERV
jgi:hypothetical protein